MARRDIFRNIKGAEADSQQERTPAPGYAARGASRNMLASIGELAEKAAKAERERLKAEAEQRIGMFLEVLEIDPEDPVATMGLGQAYIQLDRHADAIPYLETATRVQKDFSAAYLNLGKCHEVLGDATSAREAYTTGIEVAGRKGDLMPMREMERRLKQLL